MTRHRFTLLMAISACIVALAAQMALTPARAVAAAPDASNKVSIRPVRPIMMGMPNSTPLPAAGSQLIRGKDAVFMTLNTRALNPNWVYTVWFGIFNNPSACATRPCSGADFANPAVMGSRVNGGGRIIGDDGAAAYGSFLGIGDTAFAFDGPGLLDPKHAEIHLVVRSHGPALAGPALMAQLTTFNGGCPPNMCVNVQVSVHAP